MKRYLPLLLCLTMILFFIFDGIGQSGYYVNKVKQYRRTTLGNLNYGVPRTSSTYWFYNETNLPNTTVTVTTDTATITSNIVAQANEINIANTATLGITTTVTSACMIRSLTLRTLWRSTYCVGLGPSASMNIYLEHGSSGKVLVKQMTPVAGFTIYAAPAYQTADVTFDPASVVLTSVLETDIDNGGAAFAPGYSYQPSGGAAGFATFTNASANGTWILTIENKTGHSFFWFMGYTVAVTGDAQSVTTTGFRTKDLTPRSLSEAAPYTYINGVKTYAIPRNVVDQ